MIEFQNVHKTYRVAGRDIPALNPTSLTIEDGQVFGLIGHSGAGKSTMLRLINRLEEPSGGKIVVDGGDAPKAARVMVGYQAPVQVGEDGSFKIAEVSAGKHDLNIYGANFAAFIQHDVEVKPGKQTDVGTITTGAAADLVVLDAPSHVHLAYRPGVPLVHTVVASGEIAYQQGNS